MELQVWMDPIEHSQVLAVLYALQPARCLEWGSGGSTQSFLSSCPFVREWVSVEHDAHWAKQVRDALRDPRLALHHVAPDRPLAGVGQKHSEAEVNHWNARAEHEPELMASYVAFPRSLSGSFDFVLVDGRARRFCIAEGFQLLRSGGVLVLHDAQREDYHDALRAAGDPVFLRPWKQGQIALLRKNQ